MLEISLVVATVMAIGKWLKGRAWFPNSLIPLSIVLLTVAFNLINALLFDGDLLASGKLALIEALAAIGIHSGLKNTFEGRSDFDDYNAFY